VFDVNEETFYFNLFKQWEVNFFFIWKY
jgi:hypothetical protein